MPQHVSLIAARVVACVSMLGCQGDVSPTDRQGADGGRSAAADGGAAGSNGGADGSYLPGAGDEPPEPVLPFEGASVQSYVRKVKNLLTGLAPTEQEVASVAGAKDAKVALKKLIDGWTSPENAAAYGMFREKMLWFFTNSFQQTGFTPTEDFKPQLLENGGFDLGPLGVFGDDALPKLVQNLQESFARTTWEIVDKKRPFNEVLTTQSLMMTTALMSLHLQLEMPNDQPFARAGQTQAQRLAWRIDLSGVDIPLEQTLDPSSPNFMVFDDERPLGVPGFELQPTCQGTVRVNTHSGYAQLFQRLIGFTPRYPYAAQPECWEHASKPYFTASDLSDWRMVEIRPLANGQARVQPYDLPALRATSVLNLALPRTSFFTTPSYLALWNTNDSNQHRVTANQTLLVALGRSFTSDAAIVPVSTVGLDAEHAVETTVCYGCHKSLDPLRQFWANEFDFNDRNDFPARLPGGTGNPRPGSKGGVFAFANLNLAGANIRELGGLLSQVSDTGGEPELNRFAVAFAQKLCFWANSAACSESDPEFRRVTLAFQSDNFNYLTLVRELMSSALVTVAARTQTFDLRNPLVSVARRDQLCQALSNRLGQADVCALKVAFPYQRGFGGQNDPIAAQRAMARLASALPADAFGRGSENPVTPPEPTLFYRAASEMVCESTAALVVDGANSRYNSADPQGAIADMVQTVMGYAGSDPHAAEAAQILNAHFQEARASNQSAVNALRSTFALACQSPTSLSFGL